MVTEVLVVNPSKRPKKRRTMSALQRKYFGKKKKRSSVKRRVKTRSYKRNPIGLAANPRRKRRSVRRNPIGGLRGFTLQGTVMPTMIGAGGAILTDLAMGFLPIPDTLKTGALRPLVKAGAAVGIGFLVGMLTNKATGHKAMAGGLTVVAYDAAKTFLQQNVPQLPLAGVGNYPMMEYTRGMGALLDEQAYDMGNLVDESSIDGMGNLIDESSIDGMGALLDPDYGYNY